MSVKTREAYFLLARALTLASLADDLNVPTFPQDATDVSASQLSKYRDTLKITTPVDLDSVEPWKFGENVKEINSPAGRYRDYVFLQQISSQLRTRLSEDLNSRDRPK